MSRTIRRNAEALWRIHGCDAPPLGARRSVSEPTSHFGPKWLLSSQAPCNRSLLVLLPRRNAVRVSLERIRATRHSDGLAALVSNSHELSSAKTVTFQRQVYGRTAMKRISNSRGFGMSRVAVAVLATTLLSSLHRTLV